MNNIKYPEKSTKYRLTEPKKNHQIDPIISKLERKKNRNSLVIIDGEIEARSLLIGGVLPGIEAIALDGDGDGIRQIAEVLRQKPHLSKIHIISHGFPGGMNLGNARLDLKTLDEYADLLKRWSCDRIFLYGCNVAAGDAGSEFIEKLHHLTGADIAASATRIGNAALGGDWQLDVTTGDFEVDLAIDERAIAAYPHVFPAFDWRNQDWPAGATGSNAFSDVDESGIDVDIALTSDPGISFEPDALTNQPTPDDYELFYGGADELQLGLNLFIRDTTSGNDSVTLAVSFSEPVQWVSFQALDIDESNDLLWRDQMTINGENSSGADVDPVLIAAENPTYTISEATATGTGGDAQNEPGLESERGTLTAFFTEPIQSFSLNYQNELPSDIIHGVGILNNFVFDPTIALTPEEITRVEGDDGTTSYEYTVTLSDPLYVPLEVEYTTDDGTATAGEDYIAESGVLRFEPGETEKTITVQANGDTIPEPDEQFTVTLADATFQNPNTDAVLGNATIVNDTAIGIIEDDDGAPPDAVNDTATTEEGTAVTIDVLDNDSDPDGDELEIAEVGTPSNGTAEIDDDRITYTPDEDFNGTDSFTYTIGDGNGGTDTATVEVAVEPPTTPPENFPPTAEPDGAATTENEPLTIPAEELTGNDFDPEGDPLTIAEVGNPSNGTVSLDPETGEVTFTPDPDFTGVATFEYTAADPSGNTSTATVEVAVEPPTTPPENFPPTAEPDSAATTENEPLTIPAEELTGNDFDPEGDPLTIADVGNPSNGTVSLDPETGDVTFTPDPGFTGIATFEYVATDPSGNTGTTTVEVAVNPPQNLPPIANPDRATTPENIPVAIDVADNDTDEDGTLDLSSLTVTAEPENGEVTVDPDTGEVTYAPDPGFNGTDGFTYTIEDDEGAVSNPAPVTVGAIAVNEPPVADNINVAVAPGETVPVPLTGSDSDGSIASFTLDTLPDRAEGSLLLDGEPVEAGQTLTPEEASQLQFRTTGDFDGVGFTFSVTDDEGATSAAAGTVSAILPPPNQPPIAQNVNVSLEPGDSAPVPLMGEDPDGAIARFTIESLPDRAEGALLLDGEPVEAGRVLTPEEAMQLQFRAAEDFEGGNFTYSVTDDEGATSPGEATAVLIPQSPANQAPTAFDDAGETPADTPIALDVVANDTDPDGDIDPSTVDLDPDAPGLQQTLTLGDRGTLIADESGSVTFNPASGFQGTVRVPYTVRDDDGETSDPAEITVEIVNAPPTAVDDSTRTPFDTPVTFDITDNDTDPDGQIDPATVDLDPGTVATEDSFAIDGRGQFEVDEAGNLTFTPASGFSGTVATPYTVRDDDGAVSNPAEISVTVEPFVQPPLPEVPFFPPLPSEEPAEPNRPPVVEPDTVIGTENEPLTIPSSELLRNDRDPDGDPLRIVDVGDPDNGTVTLDPDTGEIVFVPEPGFTGTATFEYTVSDDEGNTGTATTRVNVRQAETELPREEPDIDIPRQDDADDCSCPPLPDRTGVPLPVPPELIPAPGLVPIDGTPLNDVLIGDNASEAILAFGGTDVLQGNLGNDFLGGDAGDDTLLAGQYDPASPRDLSGQDSLSGGAGNDFLSANEADDMLRGGDGDDVAYGGKNGDRIYGDQGNDRLYGDNGDDTIIGTPGNLTAADGQEADALYGYRDNDLIQGGPGPDSIYGGKRNDFSYGGKNDDWMWGDLGDDTLYGDDGNDTVFGDTDLSGQVPPEGSDLLWGGSGSDVLSGNRNTDTVVGGDGGDVAYGGKENDLVYGLGGNDLLFGDLGDDHVCGGEGNDTLFGDRDNPSPVEAVGLRDTLNGGAGDDWLSGNEGQDKLCGGEGGDTLYGGKDGDTLKGNAGDDWLFGDEGDDSLSGGAGSDRFVLFADGGTDTVADFLSGVDFIALGGGVTFDQLAITQEGTSAVVTLGTQRLAVLEGVQAATLTADDFTAFPI